MLFIDRKHNPTPEMNNYVRHDRPTI